MDYQEYMEKMQLSSYKTILTTIETLKELAPDIYKYLSWELDECEEELNAEQMTEYCKKRIKELEEKESEIS